MSVLAFIYTTPWDSFLIHQGVWWYAKDHVLGTVFKIPYEEYMFFFLQTWIASGIFLFISKPSSWTKKGLNWRQKGRWLTFYFLIVESIFVYGLFYDSAYYLSLIMAWCFPVVFIQIYFGLELLLRRFLMVYGTVFLVSCYLWFCDWYAISKNIWMISPDLTTGFNVMGLPVEEMIFFFMTNIMVCQGVSLFLDPDLKDKLASSGSFFGGIRKW